MVSSINRKVTIRDAPMPIALLLLSFCMPIELSVNIGSLNLTMTKVVLLILSFLLIVRRTPFKKHTHDYALNAFVLWLILSLIINHGILKAIESGGLYFLEIWVSYYAVRHYIKTPAHIYGLLNLLVLVAMILLPFLVIENFTGVHFIHDLASSVTGIHYPLKDEVRLGLSRASGPFNHPILLGVFFSAMLGMFWYSSRSFMKLKKLKIFVLIATTFTALSSAPMLVVMVQFFIIFWKKYTTFIRYRWKIIFIAMAFVYIFLMFYSDRSPLMAILSRITMDSHNSFYRTLIWDYGMQNVINNPVFGLGFHDWERVDWMVSSTVDNFWLLQTMRFGMPAIFFISLTIYSLMKKVNEFKEMEQLSEYKLISMGWLVTMFSFILVGFTVDFFGNNMPYFFFVLGLGAAIYKVQMNTYKNNQRN